MWKKTSTSKVIQVPKMSGTTVLQPFLCLIIGQGAFAWTTKSSLEWQLVCPPSSNWKAELLIPGKWKEQLSLTRTLEVPLLQQSPAFRSFCEPLSTLSLPQSSLPLVCRFPELSAWHFWTKHFVQKHKTSTQSDPQFWDKSHRSFF